MNKYIVSDIEDRQHHKIYSSEADGAFIDSDSSQQGWEEFEKITTGDMVYVINANKRVILGYEVTNVLTKVLLEDHPKRGPIYKSIGDGTMTAIFGEPKERVDQEHSIFIKENDIASPKINVKTGKMLLGFKCAAFN